VEEPPELKLVAGGQVEGIFTSPRFTAKDPAGAIVADKQWSSAADLGGHEGALTHILDWLSARHADRARIVAVGHRVVHGGTEFAAPVRIDASVVARLENW